MSKLLPLTSLKPHCTNQKHNKNKTLHSIQLKMCKAHVLRFSCSHGLLMSLDFCTGGPCPLLKGTGKSLPQQPRCCYNCQKKRNQSNASSTSSSRASCGSSVSSDDSDHLAALTSSVPRMNTKPPAAGDYVMRPCMQSYGSSVYQKTFSFACNHDHPPPPQYDSLPAFLPHQNHDCPCCQFEAVRARSDIDITADAVGSWPLVREDRQKSKRPEWEWKESLGAQGRYIDERRQEEKEMLYMVARKWEQDLRAMRVMFGGEAGASLMG